MGTKVCSRYSASEGARLRPSFRLALGTVAFDLMPDGRVRVAAAVDGATQEFRDLAAFIVATRSNGGA